jgi:arylsulfatase
MDARSHEADARRNVVLVSVDSLRADHCGFLGDDRGLTPAMDRLAAGGVNFEAAVAPGPQTFSSMPAVFTGRRRPAVDLDAYSGESHWKRRLAAVEAHLQRHGSLAERFSELGYATAGVSPNPWTSLASGFDRGFDVFADMAGEGDQGLLRTLLERTPGVDTGHKPVELALDMLTGSSFFAQWQSVREAALAAREQLEEPYFLWVFLMDTHYPFLPARADRVEQSLPGMLASTVRSESAMRGHAETMPDGVRASMERSYRDTVRAADRFVERLQADLAADDPAYLMHADHGESFGEHGNWGHHHRELYEENVHVPFVVHDGVDSERVTEPASLAAVPEVALSVAREGTFDPREMTRPAVVATSECGTNRAVRHREFKYAEHGDDPALYALLDGVETTDLAEEYPERCADSRDWIERFERHHDEVDGVVDAARSVADDGRL